MIASTRRTTEETMTRQGKEVLSERQPMDRLLFLMTLMLLCVGIVTVFSASYAVSIEHRHGDPFFYVKLQSAWALVAVLAMLLTRAIPYWRWKRFAVPAVTCSFLLLVGVLIPHIGMSAGGARRWIGHGPIRMQPSELAKIALILYLAKVATVGPRTLRNFRDGLLPILLIIGLMAALIAKEPDLGTAIVLGGSGLIMLLLAGARKSHMGVVLLVVAMAVTLFAVTSPYRMQRLSAFTNPKADQYGTGYQVWHSLIALGSGGVTGTSLGEGREKFYIPGARTDFIFAVVGEEWGLIGTLAMLTIFVLIAARGYAIAHASKDPYGALLAAGVTTVISLQALINIAVATSSIPNTGVPLPLISYGGSSLVLMLAGIGMVLNVSCYPEGPPKLKAASQVEANEAEFQRRWDRGLSASRLDHRDYPSYPTSRR